MRALVVSPTPSHPQHQGNNARVFHLCRILQSFGTEIDFVYYGMEGLHPDWKRQMSSCWAGFHFLRSALRSRMTYPDRYGLDDWFDERLGRLVSELSARSHYDVCLVNYVWLSRAFEFLPASVVKVIDTHDLFGGRHHRCAAAGMPPQWYFCSKADESRGLDRADLVLAIQSHEAELLRERTSRRVLTIGHVVPARFVPRRAPNGPLRVGYLASGNPWNVQSLLRLDEQLAQHDALADPAKIKLYVAGSICAALGERLTRFQSLGFIEQLADFYCSMDVVVNPMVGGTGLKIKSVEALAFGVPLVSTSHGMVGIASDFAEHNCSSMAELCTTLSGLVEQPERLEQMASASRQVFLEYQAEGMRAIQQLIALLRAELERAASSAEQLSVS